MDRRAITVSGIVQGVGFRPFVHGLASKLHLQGFVKNSAGSVLIEVEGDTRDLDAFLDALTNRPPPLARIDRLHWSTLAPRGDPAFRIEPSEPADSASIFISPDIATCDDCLAELFDPRDRRYRYPFLNCTNCGPRLTIITGSPYDRERTTMAPFTMCPPCRAEYDDPHNRRFHAQPTACPACGPQLTLLDRSGRPVPANDPIAHLAQALHTGSIAAIKGLGGYHLACSAHDDRAVAELRSRKRRYEKPFAVMVADLAAAAALCEIAPEEAEMLASRSRPIVLLRPKPGNRIADEVAPSNPVLGVMLPYTPLHHLLLREILGTPLVMTSGNQSDEPIAFDDRDALARLGSIADFFLSHNRPIHIRCDDSVTRIVAGAELPLRRSRGHAPEPIRMPVECKVPTLATGGQMKATFALARDHNAFLSHHIGDLDYYEAARSHAEAIRHYEQLFDCHAEYLVHDLHPDYLSTLYVRNHAAGRPTLAVQHHHAHMTSCMSDNMLNEPVIGVTFDGTGYGTDGTIWGGEFLIGDYRDFRRAAHLRPIRMPGGEAAVREPWRMAAAYLHDAGLDFGSAANLSPAQGLRAIRQLLDRGVHAPITTSAGRLFDAVAALAGVRHRVAYEAQAAIELEWLASQVAPDGSYPFEMKETADSTGDSCPIVLDTTGLIDEVCKDVTNGVSPAVIGRRFHSTIVELIARVCIRLRSLSGLEAVVLSGGVFMNALLTTEVIPRLESEGFRVYRHRRVPPNDGGISLGQLAVAAARQSVE
jgi:hydrogenase maturation protein HypF